MPARGGSAHSSKKTLDFALHYTPKRRDHRNVLCGVQVTAGTQAAFFAESLPTSMRYTVSALGMTLAGLYFGAPIAFIAAWIFQNTANGTVALTAIALGLVGELHHCHADADAAGAVQAVAPRGALTAARHPWWG